MSKDEHQDQHSADEVAGDHEPLHVPMVHKNAGNRADDGHGKHKCDGDCGDLNGRPVPAERDKADHAKEGKKIAKDADKLGEPERAKWLVFQDCFTVKAAGIVAEELMILSCPEARLSQARVLCAATGAKKFTGRFRPGRLRMQTIASTAAAFRILKSGSAAYRARTLLEFLIVRKSKIQLSI